MSAWTQFTDEELRAMLRALRLAGDPTYPYPKLLHELRQEIDQRSKRKRGVEKPAQPAATSEPLNPGEEGPK